MALTRDEVLKVAKLARLKFPDDKIEQLQENLNEILDYVDMLGELDTTNVEPLVSVNHNLNNLRDDVVKASLPVKEALKNSPNYEDGEIIVPKAIGEN